ncbi:MAG: tRNA (5-methylaminomethyl-2-thiouridylate)-methyltransferase [Fusobacteriaceae bacterium]
MEKKVRALALFSGGLDSALAIKIIKEQGIEVVALNFVSHFFGGKDERAENMARQLDVELVYVPFQKRHMDVVKDPVYGRGKNMNPCIDCHALMFKIAGELMEKYDADFIISGEVLGQRPMSQNYEALGKVRDLSGMGDYIVRPLSAKKLPMTKPEEDGLLDREQLLSIEGRGRSYQMELMDKYKLVEYPSPGGGCLLTDIDYSKKLRAFEQDGILDHDHAHLFYLTKIARVFRFGEKKYVFVGRDNDANHKMMEYREIGNHIIRSFDIAGPLIILCGEFTQEDKNLAMEFFSRYSKVKGKEEISVLFDNVKIVVPPIDIEKVERLMKEFQDIGAKPKNKSKK